jgi:hypothetical protein
LVDEAEAPKMGSLLILGGLHKKEELSFSKPGTALAFRRADELLVFSFTSNHSLSMKASLFSFVAAAAFFAATAASAAPVGHEHDRDLRRLSPRERAHYEQAQREQARYEQIQRDRLRQQALERARWEAQHRRGPARSYGR